MSSDRCRVVVKATMAFTGSMLVRGVVEDALVNEAKTGRDKWRVTSKEYLAANPELVRQFTPAGSGAGPSGGAPRGRQLLTKVAEALERRPVEPGDDQESQADADSPVVVPAEISGLPPAEEQETELSQLFDHYHALSQQYDNLQAEANLNIDEHLHRLVQLEGSLFTAQHSALFVLLIFIVLVAFSFGHVDSFAVLLGSWQNLFVLCAAIGVSFYVWNSSVAGLGNQHRERILALLNTHSALKQRLELAALAPPSTFVSLSAVDAVMQKQRLEQRRNYVADVAAPGAAPADTIFDAAVRMKLVSNEDVRAAEEAQEAAGVAEDSDEDRLVAQSQHKRDVVVSLLLELQKARKSKYAVRTFAFALVICFALVLRRGR
eukprot:TRINITY_DN1897_c0_g1_i1.p1 TRINITY_DN1897_c0_g1~~TRINITY_DN1897_c0_g1_i1.p1  ORF type:complete len:377 (-),score=98.82 TRINITY_DN1897_c0_g1_i1:25-1155(-)